MSKKDYSKKVRQFKLTIDLVPSTVWYSSVYQILKEKNMLDEWKRIKKRILEKEGCRCYVCGKEDIRLEANEFWEYDDKKRIQKLVAIHHLCGMCHKIKHIGLWCYTLNGKKGLKEEGLSREDLIKHFCKVNSCTKKEFLEHESESFKVWKERSKHPWKQDFGEYENYLKQTPKNFRKPSQDTENFWIHCHPPEPKINWSIAKAILWFKRSANKYLNSGKIYPLNIFSDDLIVPQTETEKLILSLDHEAIMAARSKQYEMLPGKWLIFVENSEVDAAWENLASEIESGRLPFEAKVSTVKKSPLREERRGHVICVYTPNFLFRKDVRNCRVMLKDLGFDSKLYYKPDLYTYKGFYRIYGSKITHRFFG